MGAGQREGQGHAGIQRRAVLLTVHVHEAAERADHDVRSLEVPVGPVLPEGRYGAHDQAGIHLPQGRVAQAQAVQVAGGEGLNDHIGVLHHVPEGLLALAGLDVQGNAFLASVVGEPGKALVRVGRVVVEGADETGRIASGSLDLHHPAAEIGQNPAAGLPAGVGQVQHCVVTQNHPHLLYLGFGRLGGEPRRLRVLDITMI